MSWKRRVANAFPLTWAGLILAMMLGVAVYLRALPDLDLVVLAAAGGMGACYLILLLAVGLGSLALRRALQRPPSALSMDLVVGERRPSGYRLAWPFYLPFVTLDWEVEGIPTEVERGRELLRPTGRGLLSEVRRTFRVRDVLGVSALNQCRTGPARLRILPSPGKLEDLTILRSLMSGEDMPDPHGDPSGDRVDMRQYQPGDPMKFILWKVYSRAGKLMVRVPEKALTLRPRACAYLVTGPGDEPAAGLARLVIERELLGAGWRFGADGCPGYAATVDRALDMLAASGNAPAPCGLPAFLKQAERDGYAYCLVLAPPDPGDKTAAVRAQTRMRVDLWIGVDLPARQQPRQGWRRLLLSEPNEAPLELDQIRKRWGQRAVVLERSRGRVVRR